MYSVFVCFHFMNALLTKEVDQTTELLIRIEQPNNFHLPSGNSEWLEYMTVVYVQSTKWFER